MQPKPMVLGRVLLATACVALLTLSAGAQQSSSQQTVVQPRITKPVDEANLVTLKGNTHPLARPEFDLGPAPANLPLNRMLLVLSRSPEEEAALQSFLDQQQDKSSPNYHNWLTPEQFGQQFGPADQDVQAVTSWLQTHGFQVDRVSKGRVVIEFSGAASQLQEAFHTEIHKYAVNGEEHWANSSDPQIPAALAPVVTGIKTLHDFYKKSQILITGEQFKAKFKPGSLPEFTASNGIHALAPADYATIYNINPLYAATPAINGAGTTIAVIGRSDFLVQDVIDFRNSFLLPGNTPQIVINGPDPGILNEGEQFEATLDATWSGAVAPGAQVVFVVSASTNTTDGLDLSEEYIIDNDLGNVMTESFSGCEAGATSAEASSISSLAEQAAAEGITYMVSTGDSGAEGCDNPDTETRATGPVSVNILASSPYTVGVGGTLFVEGANAAKYWSSTNQSNGGSALSYIPEDVWNESCVSGCGQSGGGAIWAGGGGASTLFSKPPWQSVVSGIPPDGHRDLPDVSLTAAGHDPYLLCFNGSCEQGFFDGVSGTSASAPSFAGIMALVNQKTGSKQGQANYVLYRLAAQETLSKCNASSPTTAPASTCIFNDVTTGNNAVPGEVGYGTSTAKYQSTVGYDPATGLGSVNVANLVNGWGSARSVVSATTLSITPSTGATHGTPLDVTISVGAAPPATGSPTGDVALIGDFGSSLSGETEVVNLTLINSTASSTSVNQLPGGTYNVQAHYEGDGTFVPSDSTAVKVNILPEPTTETAAALTGAPPNLTSFATQVYGNPLYLQATVAGKSGVGTPTGTITFTDSVQGSLGSATLDNTGTAITTNLAQVIIGGSRSVTASYPGDASFKKGTSPAVTFSLTPDATTTQIAPRSTPLVSGQAPQLTASVNANSFGAAPTGTVTAFVGSNQIGTPVQIGALDAGGPTVTSVAFVPLGALPLGQSTVTTTYGGDSNYQGSTSAPLNVNILRPSVTTLTSSASTIMTSQSVTLTARITSSQSGPAATGTVQFEIFGYINPNLGTVSVANGQAQLITSSLPAGTPQITATYSGDSNYANSSGTIVVTVNAYQSTTSLTTSNASVSQGSSVTFTATVTPAQSGSPALTGSVEFVEGDEGVAKINLSANGQAQFITSSLPTGTTQIFANYSGDFNYNTSSASLMETVNPAPTFMITDNSPTATVASPGLSGSTMLTFTAENGFTGSQALTASMCSHLPSESTCSFSPSALSLTAQTTSQTVMLTISTMAPSSVTPSARRFTPGPWRGTAQIALACGLCFGLLLFGLRARPRRWSTVVACVAFVAIATFSSCGGGGSTGPPPPPPNPGTPVGNYTGVTVTVTMGGVTQSINTIAVNVE
jgi:hypothetical protein